MAPFNRDAPGPRHLGSKGRNALIVLLSAFIPLSIDLYLPALPRMAEYLGSSMNLVNLTLIAFFVFYALGILFWGPLSDKYGRKPVLLAGLAIYLAASIMCALSADVYQLIGSRVVQALGGGSAVAVATAMIKDVYSGRRRESMLAMVQAMVIIAPIVAPVLGALILRYTSWHGIFWALAGVGALALCLSLGLEETLADRYQGGILQTLGRLGVVLKNPGFSWLLAVFSLVPLPFMAYIASSSYIYIDRFGLGEQEFSFFFAFNSASAMAGPLLYIPLSRFFERRTIINFCLAAEAAGGAFICLWGAHSPWMFALCLMPATMAISGLRPPATNLMLEQQQGDTGSVSSLISCSGLLMGSLGMLIISFKWPDLILALGIMHLAVGMVCTLLWLRLGRKALVKPVSEAAGTGT